MRSYSVLLLALAGLFLVSCQKDKVSTTTTDDYQQFLAEAEQRLADADAGALAEEAVYVSGRAPGVLPAGSVDGLADAIAEVGPYGTVVVESGLHIETGTVIISHPVRIVGEPGAVIQSTTHPAEGLPYVVDAAIYIDHARQVHIEGLSFVPDPATGQGGTGILVSYSDRAFIRDNDFSEYLQAVVVHKSDQARIFYNRATGLYSEGFATFTSYGFIVASGQNNYLKGNAAEDFWGNYFVSGQDGILNKNTATAGEDGFIFCTYPPVLFTPSGEEAIAAEVSSTGWLAVRNTAQNARKGYVVIDGANNCRLVNNNSLNNPVYDYEIVGPTERFGPPALPTTFNNVVIINDSGDVTKNCGDNNRVYGGTLVGLTVEPCS